MKEIPRVLTIAGSDSGGGAGIQADLKTIAMHGCFGMSAITAVTVQNTKAVLGVEQVSANVVEQQIHAVIEDLGIDAIKIGLLPSMEVIEKVAAILKTLSSVPIVLDPVIGSTSGISFLRAKEIACLRKELFPFSILMTPNVVELEAFAGKAIASDADIERAGKRLLESGLKNVLITGGDREGSKADDCMVSSEGTVWLRGEHILTSNTHGTGCTLSTSIACGLAKGLSLMEAAREAKAFVRECLHVFNEVSLGKGPGPIFPTIMRSV